MTVAAFVAILSLTYMLFKDCNTKWVADRKECIDVVKGSFEEIALKSLDKEQSTLTYLASIKAENISNIVYFSFAKENGIVENARKYAKSMMEFAEGSQSLEDFMSSYKDLMEQIYTSKPHFGKYLLNIFPFAKYLTKLK